MSGISVQVHTAIIAGLPTSANSRLRKALQADPLPGNWEFECVSSDRQDAELRPSTIDRVLDIACCSESPHVLGFTKRGEIEKRAARAAINPFFRFRWLPNSLIDSISRTTADALVEIKSMLKDEEAWVRIIRPSSVAHPLLLPVPYFQCDARDALIWSERVFETGNEAHWMTISQKLEAFAERFRQSVSGRQRWMDSSSVIFDYSGARHGEAPGLRKWKHSYRMPDGFHFDVQHVRGSPYVLKNASEQPVGCPANGHINMDPHGYIR